MFAARTCVVIPAFNEVSRITETLASIPAYIDHIVVVDDNSNDGTVSRARASTDPRLVVVEHARNRGVGAAIATGYVEARRLGAEIIAVMAGDGQMDPQDLPTVLQPIALGNADYVKGSRLGHPEIGRMPLKRRFGTWALGIATSHATGLPGITDSQCGYTAIRGSLVDKLPIDRLFPRYGYPNDLLSLVAMSGGRVAEVTVRPVYRGERSGLRAYHVVGIVGLILRGGVRRIRRKWATA